MTKSYLKYSLFRNNDNQHYYIFIHTKRDIKDIEAYALENIAATESNDYIISDIFPDTVKYSVVFLDHVCRF